MIQAKLSQQFIDLLKSKITLTTRMTGNINWLIKTFEDNPDNPPLVVQTCMDYLTSDNVQTTNTFDRVISFVRLCSNWDETSEDIRKAFREVLVIAEPFREEKEGPKKRSAVLRSSDFKDYVRSLDAAIPKVLTIIGFMTGAKPNCLMRDKHKLSKIHEGLIDVEKSSEPKHSQARLIEFDPSFIHEVDPQGEISALMSDVVFSKSDSGLVARDVIGKWLDNTAFDFYQLRASCAIRMRLDEGLNWKQIANKLGVKNASTLRERVLAYAAMNGIAID